MGGTDRERSGQVIAGIWFKEQVPPVRVQGGSIDIDNTLEGDGTVPSSGRCVSDGRVQVVAKLLDL